MNWKTLKFFAISLVCFLTFEARAQDDAFTCFNAQEILFPLSLNDFSNNEVLVNDRKYNAFYYLYEDKYSFWYKFIER
jgi:hypothetical protein